MRAWMDLTAAEIKRVLEAEGIPLSGPQGTKAEFAAYAQSVLGPDPDAPVLVVPGSDARSVAERMIDVLADLPAIGKDEQAPVNMGGYRYRGIEQITAAIKPLLAKHGVVMLPRVIERRDGERPTHGGGVMHVVDQHIEFTFVGRMGDRLTASMWGEGTDSGDKSPQKSATSAFKSMLSIAFCISDAETDAERHDVPDTVARQRASKDDRDLIGQWMLAVPEAHRGEVQDAVRSRFGPAADLMADQVDAVIGYVEACIAAGLKAAASGVCAACGGSRLVTVGDGDDAHEEECPECAPKGLPGDAEACVECGAPADGPHQDECSRRPL